MNSPHINQEVEQSLPRLEGCRIAARTGMAVSNRELAIATYDQELFHTERALNSDSKALAKAQALLDQYDRLIRAMDLQAQRETRIEDGEEVVVGYRFNTGLWHRLLGLRSSREELLK